MAAVTARPDLLGLPGVLEAAFEDGRVRFQVQDELAVPGVVTALVQAGAKLTRVQPEQITLEDVYFKLQEQSRQGVK